jgi:heme exporter protein C
MRIIREHLLTGIAAALMVAALWMVFIYVPTEKASGIIQRIFYFHVPVAWIAFLAFFVTFVFSVLYLRTREAKWDHIAGASAEIGVVFTTMVLITGPIWAKPAWGIWWTWDARLTASLVLWIIYIAYHLVRSFTAESGKSARYGAVIGVLGFIDVPVVFLAVNLWRTQHPDLIVFEGGLAPPMVYTLLVCIAAFTLLYAVLVIRVARLKGLEADVRRLKNIMAEREE